MNKVTKDELSTGLAKKADINHTHDQATYNNLGFVYRMTYPDYGKNDYGEVASISCMGDLLLGITTGRTQNLLNNAYLPLECDKDIQILESNTTSDIHNITISFTKSLSSYYTYCTRSGTTHVYLLYIILEYSDYRITIMAIMRMGICITSSEFIVDRLNAGIYNNFNDPICQIRHINHYKPTNLPIPQILHCVLNITDDELKIEFSLIQNENLNVTGFDAPKDTSNIYLIPLSCTF